MKRHHFPEHNYYGFKIWVGDWWEENEVSNQWFRTIHSQEMGCMIKIPPSSSCKYIVHQDYTPTKHSTKDSENLNTQNILSIKVHSCKQLKAREILYTSYGSFLYKNYTHKYFHTKILPNYNVCCRRRNFCARQISAGSLTHKNWTHENLFITNY